VWEKHDACSLKPRSSNLEPGTYAMVSPVILRGCPRCGGTLDLYDDFPRCVMCGWQDYFSLVEAAGALSSSSSTLAAATEKYPDRVYYRGARSRFEQDEEIKAQLSGSWGESSLECPYDGGDMGYVGPTTSGERLVQVYSCGKKHRVRLWHRADGKLAWR